MCGQSSALNLAEEKPVKNFKASTKKGALLPISIFLIVSIAAIVPFMVQHMETNRGQTQYLGEWNKIDWAVSGIKRMHDDRGYENIGLNPYGNSTVATISYDNFHVEVSIVERTTMLNRNFCYGFEPRAYRGTSPPYVDAGYDLSEYTVKTVSAPGVAAGANHSFAWMGNGNLYSWGNSGKSQLGRGGDNASPGLVEQGLLPTKDVENFNQGWLVAGGNETSIAVDYLGKPYGWGKLSNKSLLGIFPSVTNENYAEAPVPLTKFDLATTDVLDIAGGKDFVAVVSKAGDVYLLSWNTVLGNTDNKFVKLAHMSNVQGISAGENHLIAITENGDLWGYGSNTSYQLGRPNTSLKGPLLVNEAEVVLVSQVASKSTTVTTPTANLTKFFLSSPYNLATFTVEANAERRYKETPTAFAAGDYYKDYILLEHSNPDFTRKLFPKSQDIPGRHFWKFENTRLEPGTYTVKLQTEKTTLYKILFWEYRNTSEESINGKWYKNNTTGDPDRNKGVYTFYGSPILPKSFIGVAAGGNSSFAIKKDDDTPVLYAWGANTYGQLGLGHNSDAESMAPVPDFTGTDKIRTVAAGGAHTLVLTEGGKVYSFGRNNNGQLGLNNTGDSNNKNTPTLIPQSRFGNNAIISIAAGDSHSMAMDHKFNVYTWGYNGQGRLGHGDTVNRRVPTAVSGF